MDANLGHGEKLATNMSCQSYVQCCNYYCQNNTSSIILFIWAALLNSILITHERRSWIYAHDKEFESVDIVDGSDDNSYNDNHNYNTVNSYWYLL